MNPAFQHQEGFLQGVNAEAVKTAQIVRFNMPGDNNDLDTTGIQDNRLPHMHGGAGRHRAFDGKPTI